MIYKDGNTTSFEVEIKVIDYKTDRLEYFKTMQNRQKERIELFKKTKVLDELSPMEKHFQLSEMGRIVSFYDDVVKMLEADLNTPTEKGSER